MGVSTRGALRLDLLVLARAEKVVGFDQQVADARIFELGEGGVECQPLRVVMLLGQFDGLGLGVAEKIDDLFLDEQPGITLAVKVIDFFTEALDQLHIEACFLAHFAYSRVALALVGIDAALRELPVSRVNQQELRRRARVKYHGASGLFERQVASALRGGRLARRRLAWAGGRFGHDVTLSILHAFAISIYTEPS